MSSKIRTSKNVLDVYFFQIISCLSHVVMSPVYFVFLPSAQPTQHRLHLTCLAACLGLPGPLNNCSREKVSADIESRG